VGKIHIHGKFLLEPEKSFCRAGKERAQMDRYEAVKKNALDELEQIITAMNKHDPEKASIFRAHQDMVNDVEITEEIPAKILHEHWNGDWAIYAIYDTFIRMVRQAADPLIAERAADFEDVRRRLLRLWYGKKEDGPVMFEEPVIVAAQDLLPSDAAAMDKNKVLAILTETGGGTSHSAIIARSYGIPAIMGIQGLLKKIKQGQTAAVNAVEGTVHLEPAKFLIEEHTQKNAAFLQKHKPIK
jgi:phosphotransferase system enzyme I (PtsI)